MFAFDAQFWQEKYDNYDLPASYKSYKYGDSSRRAHIVCFHELRGVFPGAERLDLTCEAICQRAARAARWVRTGRNTNPVSPRCMVRRDRWVRKKIRWGGKTKVTTPETGSAVWRKRRWCSAGQRPAPLSEFLRRPGPYYHPFPQRDKE
jgi:hypothetical protein